MLVLLFNLGAERYGIDARKVELIVPKLELRPVPHAPDFIPGLFPFREAVVPVVDLQMLTQHQSCRHCFSTRIAIVHFLGYNGTSNLLGLMAEKVTDVVRLEDHAFKDDHVSLSKAPYLGKISLQQHGMVQILDIDRLLGAPLQDLLFRTPASA